MSMSFNITLRIADLPSLLNLTKTDGVSAVAFTTVELWNCHAANISCEINPACPYVRILNPIGLQSRQAGSQGPEKSGWSSVSDEFQVTFQIQRTPGPFMRSFPFGFIGLFPQHEIHTAEANLSNTGF